MTVSTNISSVRYEGNGVTDTFSFNGRIFTNSDLSIDIITRSTDVVVETLAPSDYTVSLVSSESAEIIVAGPKIPSALQDILIYRNININQSLRLPTGTVFPASDVESALDRLTILIQDTQDDGSRSLIFPQNISGIVTPYLPSPEDGKLLVWDGDAGNVANLSVTNLVDEGFDTIFTSLVATDFLQYDGVSWVNIHNSDFPLQSIKAPTSGGLVLKNNSGTTILTIGAGGASSATFAGTLNIPDGTVSTYAKISTSVFATTADIIAGTASKIVNASNLAAVGLIQLTDPISVGTGTTKDFTIPTGVKRITLHLFGVSYNATDNPIIQLGGSGGVETSGYTGSATTLAASTLASAGTGTNGMAFANTGQVASTAFSGDVVIEKISSSNQYAIKGHISTGGSAQYVFQGHKTTTGELQTVRLTSNAASNFDAGTVGFTVEY